MNKRFEKLAHDYGFTIQDCYALINNAWVRRPDILSVRYKGHPIMVIPTKMYGFPNPRYKDMMRLEQPMYFDREYRLRNWNLLIKNTPHIWNLEQTLHP